MFAFGCSIIMPDAYEGCARPGIERAREPDSVVLAHAASGSVARGCNLLIDRAAELDDLEALVLVHQDAELLDPDFCPKVRTVLADPEIALVGAVGARGVDGIAWWEADEIWSSAQYHYGESGGGTLTWTGDRPGPPGEVDSIYGVLMVLSPWAVRHVRFDESVGLLHGYDRDASRQVRAAGRKVWAADLAVAHHHSLDLVTQIEIWVSAHMRAAELWEDGADRMSEAEWKQRARRAEADAASARLLAASKLLQADASAHQSAQHLEFVRNTKSWRLTESLRRGNAAAGKVRSRLRST